MTDDELTQVMHLSKYKEDPIVRALVSEIRKLRDALEAKLPIGWDANGTPVRETYAGD